jgi:hypothetical protein
VTLIAAICPPNEQPFFVCDTLVSEPGRQEGRVLSPNGVILQAPIEAVYKPFRLQQKNIIIRDRLFAAYAGSSLLGRGAFRRLQRALCHQTPSYDMVDAFAADFEDELNHHNTSLLVAFVQQDGVQLVTLGPRFEHLVLNDGTECYASGSGAETFLNTLPSLCEGCVPCDLLKDSKCTT